jgi:hypothetical protein
LSIFTALAPLVVSFMPSFRPLAIAFRAVTDTCRHDVLERCVVVAASVVVVAD